MLAYAERDGVQSAVENIPVVWDKVEAVQVDARRAAAWKRQHACGSTKDSYEFLARLGKHCAEISGLTIISGEGSNRDWVEPTMYEEPASAGFHLYQPVVSTTGGSTGGLPTNAIT